MPYNDGITLCSNLRERGVTLPFILLTARDPEAAIPDALDAGVTTVVEKGSGTTHLCLLTRRIEVLVNAHEARREQRYTRLLADIRRILLRCDRRKPLAGAVSERLQSHPGIAQVIIGIVATEHPNDHVEVLGGAPREATVDEDAADIVSAAIRAGELCVSEPGVLSSQGTSTDGIAAIPIEAAPPH